MIRAVLAAVGLACALLVGVLVYHAVAADRAQDAPASPAVLAAFEDAGRSWRSHMDLPVHRLVLRSAEQYGSENYLFVFDVYAWFGIGSGYVTYGPETTRCSGTGGLMRNGGFAGVGGIASEDMLSESRLGCAQAHGPGRVVAPAR